MHAWLTSQASSSESSALLELTQRESKIDQIKSETDQRESKIDQIKSKINQRERKMDQIENKIDQRESEIDQRESNCSKIDLIESNMDRVLLRTLVRGHRSLFLGTDAIETFW